MCNSTTKVLSEIKCTCDRSKITITAGDGIRNIMLKKKENNFIYLFIYIECHCLFAQLCEACENIMYSRKIWWIRGIQ